jgi:hypothetical protein
VDVVSLDLAALPYAYDRFETGTYSVLLFYVFRIVVVLLACALHACRTFLDIILMDPLRWQDV